MLLVLSPASKSEPPCTSGLVEMPTIQDRVVQGGPDLQVGGFVSWARGVEGLRSHTCLPGLRGASGDSGLRKESLYAVSQSCRLYCACLLDPYSEFTAPHLN